MAEQISLMARAGEQLVRIALQTDGGVAVTLDGVPVRPEELARPLQLGTEMLALLQVFVGLSRAGYRLQLPETLERALAASVATLRHGLEEGVSLAGQRAGARKTDRKKESGKVNAGKATLARLTHEEGSPVVAEIVKVLGEAGRPVPTLAMIEALQGRLEEIPSTTVRSTLHRISRGKSPKIVRTLDGWILS